MSKTGLIRIPYYPQLNVLCDNKIGALSLTLSVLLFWSSRSDRALFSKKEHAYQIAQHLTLSLDEVISALDTLQILGILDESILTKAQVKIMRKGALATITENDHKKTIAFLKVNFIKLSQILNSYGVHFNPRTLRHASDDSFDMYDVIVPALLPERQTLIGTLTGEDFEKAAEIIASLAIYCVHKDDDFSYKAIAPGWHMLLKKPSRSCDIVKRWLDGEQRAIDLSFTDGNLFLIDGMATGANEHFIKHYKKGSESKILGCACLLALSASFDYLQVCTDIDDELIVKACSYLYSATAIKAKFDMSFFNYRELDGHDVAKLKTMLADAF